MRVPEAAGSQGSPPPRAGGAGRLVERLRAVHLEMVDAVLGGDGLGEVAELAAEAAGAPVAIVVPRLGAAVASPAAPRRRPRRRCAATSPTACADRPAQVPPAVGGRGADHVRRRDRRRACCCWRPTPPAPEAAEFLHLAAVASLTEVAVEEASEEVEQNLRGSFLEELRSRARPRPARDRAPRRRASAATSRAARSCCAPSSPPTARATSWRRSPASTRARSRSTWTGARRTRCCPPRRRRRARGDARAPRARLADAPAAPRHRRRLGFYADPAELGRAIQEAELVLDVLRRSDAPIAEDIGTGTYRLLFRVLASHPEEVRSFYEDTVAPIVRYDDQYAHRPRRHARGLPRAELQHERDRGGDLRPPPHGRLPARAREGAHGPRPDAVRGPRAARASASRPTGSSRRGCRSSPRGACCGAGLEQHASRERGWRPRRARWAAIAAGRP